jgi:hypothetical protein
MLSVWIIVMTLGKGKYFNENLNHVETCKIVYYLFWTGLSDLNDHLFLYYNYLSSVKLECIRIFLVFMNDIIILLVAHTKNLILFVLFSFQLDLTNF